MLCSFQCRLLCIPYYIFHYMSFGQFRKYHLKTMWTDLAFTVLLYTQLFDAYRKHKLFCRSCATGSLKCSTRFVYICKKKQYETRTSHVIKAFYLLKHNQRKKHSQLPPTPFSKQNKNKTKSNFKRNRSQVENWKAISE